MKLSLASCYGWGVPLLPYFLYAYLIFYNKKYPPIEYV